VLGGVAGCALIVGATQVANGVSWVKTYEGTLVDYEVASGPFDGSSATLLVTQSTAGDETGYKLSVEGISRAAAGAEFGAHLHTGPCVPEDYADPDAIPPKAAGSKAGPHYNHDRLLDPTPEVNRRTEVWFDLVPNAFGQATFNTKVDFVPVDSTTPGLMSVVIHQNPTDHRTGAAGPRQACFPLEVTQWALAP